MRLIDADHLKKWILARWQERNPQTDRPFKAIEILDQIDREMTLEEPQWIPCSETTDIPDCEVLCCDMRGEMIVGYLDRDDESNTGWGAESDGVCLMDVVAYMPLPEPWRGDEE